MPEIPALLANTLVPLFARPTRAVAIEELSPRLKRVRFEGAALRGVRWRPGQEVEFRVSGTAFRHYTPSHFDGASGALEVVFFLHGGGPGSAWASELKAGAHVDVLGPGGGFGLDASATTHVFLGDETSLGVFYAMMRALPPGTRVAGAVEVEPGCERWPSLLGLSLEGAVRGGGPRGAPLHTWIERNRDQAERAAVYLVGHAGSIVSLRKALIDDHGRPKRAIRTKVYWADGKRGL